MRPSVIVGAAIAVVFALLLWFGPMIGSMNTRNAIEASQKAEAARRLAFRAGTHVSRVALQHELEAMKSRQDLDELIAQSKESFDQLAQQFNKEISELQRSDAQARADLPPLAAKAPSLTASGVRGAIDSFADSLKADRELLVQAEKLIADAPGGVSDVVLLPQVRGNVHYLQGLIAFAQSQAARKRLAAQRAHMLQVAASLRQTQSYIDRYVSMDVSDIVAELEQGLEEAKNLENEALSEASGLEVEVASVQQQIDQVRSEMTGTQGELREVEKTGFTAGNDASFQGYRQRYLELAGKLNELERREQELLHGGVAGAEFERGDILNASMSGGQPVTSLDYLKWRLADAQKRAEGLQNYRKSIEEKIGFIQSLGRSAGDSRVNYEERMTELRSKLAAADEERRKHFTEAFNLENEALTAAQKAKQHFAAAAQAATTWINDASTAQRENDPERTNERLRQIVGDTMARRVGESSEAAANLLIGQIHAQRVEDFTRELDTYDQIARYVPGVQIGNPEQLNTVLGTAREAGQNAVKDAITKYEAWAQNADATQWVSQAALATAYYLLGRLEPAMAGDHAVKARELIAAAVEGRRQSPYLKHAVMFFDHLAALAEKAAQEQPGIDPARFGDEGG